MTCQDVQNKILILPDPRRVPEPLREHLDGCPACLAWWKQAAWLERLLEQLPAPPPPADKKTALIDELTSAGPIIHTVPRPAAADRPLVTRRTLAYAGGLAAAVLVGVGVWLAVRPSGKPEPPAVAQRHPLLDKMVQRDVALARVANPEELNELAGWYKRVVNDGIVRQAENLPRHGLTPDQKKALLDGLAAKLAETGAEADRLANEAPPESKPALKRIAETARDGQQRLSKLAREA